MITKLCQKWLVKEPEFGNLPGEKNPSRNFASFSSKDGRTKSSIQVPLI